MGSGDRQPARRGGLRDAIVAPARWALWSQGTRAIAYCLVSELVMLAATVPLLHAAPPLRTDLAVFGALAALGIGQAETGMQVERLRRRVGNVPHINMTSVWTFAGVLLLPPVLTAALTIVLYTHLGVRCWYRMHRVPPFRAISNATVIVLTCYLTWWLLTSAGFTGMRALLDGGWAGIGVLSAAVVVYFAINALLVLPARKRIGRTPRELFGDWADNGLELATLCLGALNALAITIHPALSLLVVPPLVLLHRTVLIKQLESAASRDDKTGLFNASGWTALAERELARAQSRETTFGLLMIDLDFFKRVNDTYGHSAGDRVLRAVGAAITAHVRDHNDAVGRYGGEEFLVLLPGIGDAGITGIAERIRTAINDLTVAIGEDGAAVEITGLSASIGTATYPNAGTGLQRLLDAADMACYRAKNAGRNRIA
ncbi:GGDEF domain-containing protein [Amycolatopsis sp. CA-230715]|uniref:GGDEF domain-containing protein n=1 Tax=Amycolatopsis sp. CA-230715 TaxID=2745196 RepID=UPI001C009F61|nr:GGDEF domain-containing protein [Amycolatopsis sp. CA-230715]QWF85408.1 hypothetical protein HUW46_08862 [Amycolatopsis sp. CA-230715]